MTLKIMFELKRSVTPKQAALIKADITRVYRERIARSFVIIEPELNDKFEGLPKELEGDLT